MSVSRYPILMVIYYSSRLDVVEEELKWISIFFADVGLSIERLQFQKMTVFLSSFPFSSNLPNLLNITSLWLEH